jgi:large conductance mechanosensitive channel
MALFGLLAVPKIVSGEVFRMQGLIEFIRKQGVVGLAIGFIVGVAVGQVVNSLATDLVNPVIGLIVGNRNLDELVFHAGKATFNYGHFIGVLINFIIILAVVYFLFKVLRLERLDMEKEEEEKPKAKA